MWKLLMEITLKEWVKIQRNLQFSENKNGGERERADAGASAVGRAKSTARGLG